MASIETWAYSLGSVVLVSLISLVGLATLGVKSAFLKKVVLFLVSFSAGALFGDAFIHLLPEAVEEAGGFGLSISLSIIAGIGVFFIVEKFIRWHHCHLEPTKKHPHSFTYMNLVGDSVHNFIDGMIISASYLVSIPVGIATTVAVILHEIPQEIGDFGVLLHGGFSEKKAIFMNFLVSLFAILGAAVGLGLASIFSGVESILVPFAAGGFIYIAGSDLIPELHKDEFSWKRSLGQLATFALGILVMYSLVLLE